MGILVITWNFPPRRGGIENLMASVCSGLRRDHQLFVITSWAAPAGNQEEWVLRPRWPGLPTFFIFALFRGFLLLRRSPEIRVILGGSAMVSPLVVLLARLLRRNSIILVHGLDVLYPSPVYQALCVRWIRGCDRIIANSRHTSSLAEQKGVSREAIVVIPPGVGYGSPPLARAEEFKTEMGLGGRKILLYVGRLARRKGLKEFLESAFPGIVAEVPEVCFLIVGGNPTESLVHHDDVLGELKELVQSTKMADHVRFLGWLGDGDLAKVYQAADLMVLPARAMKDDVEGFGMVIVEGAAAGVPAVATRVGGIPDAVEDGRSGILVDPEDYETMTRKIVSLLRDDQKRSALGDYARKRAREEFGWEEVVRKHEEVLRSLSESAPKKSRR